MSKNVGGRNPLHLFVCHLEWRSKRNLAAYQELVAALDDRDREIRDLAQVLLRRSSPRPQVAERTVETAEVAGRIRRIENDLQAGCGSTG